MTLHVVLDGRVINDHFPGIGRYAFDLAAALAQHGDVHITLLYNPTAPSTRYDLAALVELAPAITLCPISIAPFTVAEQARIAPVARSLGAQVWHSLYYVMPFLGLPKPIVLTVYDLIPLVLPEYWSTRNRLIFRLAHRLALRAATHIVTLSDSARRDVIRYFGVTPGRISVTPLAAGERFKPAVQSAVTAIRAKYHLQAPYVLYVGINKPPKNLVRLIDAYARVAPNVEHDCVIAGAWDERYLQAKQRASERGLAERVHFIGPIADDDLPELYSGADLFVTPSLYEGFGLPVLEAMACGTPVACSHAASLPEVAGDAGLLFDPLDIDAIAQTIVRILTDRAMHDQLSRAGLARAAQFTWARAATQTLEVYRAVIE